MTVRQARGTERRTALVEAAVRLLSDGGPGAVTMRAVASEAGVPLAATTYYFDDRTALVAAAIEIVAGSHLDAAKALVDAAVRQPPTSPRGLAGLTTRIVADPSDAGPDAVRALYRRMVPAASESGLATAMAGWDHRVIALLERLLRACGRDTSLTRQVLAVVDGAVLAALLEFTDDPLRHAVRTVAPALDALAPRTEPESGQRRMTPSS